MSKLKATIDHFILGASNLQVAMEDFQQKTGVIPAFGGIHEKLNTHNALVSLGNHQYLEILSSLSNDGIMNGPFGNWQIVDQLKMIGWVVAINDLELLLPLLEKYSIANSSIVDLSRKTEDGKEIKWRNIFLIKENVFSLNPFFIEWGSDAIHPSLVTPPGLHYDVADFKSSVIPNLENLLIELIPELAGRFGESENQLILSDVKGQEFRF